MFLKPHLASSKEVASFTISESQSRTAIATVEALAQPSSSSQVGVDPSHSKARSSSLMPASPKVCPRLNWSWPWSCAHLRFPVTVISITMLNSRSHGFAHRFPRDGAAHGGRVHFFLLPSARLL